MANINFNILKRRKEMKGKEAGKFFHGESDLNCTQAVLKAFQSECGITRGKDSRSCQRRWWKS